MIQIIYSQKDPRYIFLTGAKPAEIAKLEKHFNKIPQYMMLPTFRGIPTPNVFLEKFKKNDQWVLFCSAGLWKELVDFCKGNGIAVDTSYLDKVFKYTTFNMTKEEFYDYVSSWGMNITPRQYQLDAAWLILKYNLSLSELATRAGKTLIFTIIARTAMEKLHAKNILMIVPSIHLVKQGVKDIEEYKDYFKSEQIWGGGEFMEYSNLTIGTFQSLVKMADPRNKKYNPKFFEKFDVVCCDEAHRCDCRSIKTILAVDAMKKMKLKFGFTGTLPKPNTIEWLSVQAMLGPKIQEISARELIDEGFLADPIIKQFRLMYDKDSIKDEVIRSAEYLLSNYKKEGSKTKILLPKESQKMTRVHEKELPQAIKMAKEQLSKDDYMTYLLNLAKGSSQSLNVEQMTSLFSEPKIKLIERIVSNVNKNIIVFAHNTEYIKYLHKRLTELLPDKKVMKMTGSNTVKNRQKIMEEMKENDNCVLIGSFGVISTGLTFPNVDYGLFAQSFASDVITRQSLGRLMLRTKEKSEFYLYDIIDVYPTKKIYNQGLAKIRSYKEEGHRYEIDSRNVLFESINI